MLNCTISHHYHSSISWRELQNQDLPRNKVSATENMSQKMFIQNVWLRQIEIQTWAKFYESKFWKFKHIYTGCPKKSKQMNFLLIPFSDKIVSRIFFSVWIPSDFKLKLIFENRHGHAKFPGVCGSVNKIQLEREKNYLNFYQKKSGDPFFLESWYSMTIESNSMILWHEIVPVYTNFSVAIFKNKLQFEVS